MKRQSGFRDYNLSGNTINKEEGRGKHTEGRMMVDCVYPHLHDVRVIRFEELFLNCFAAQCDLNKGRAENGGRSIRRVEGQCRNGSAR